MTLIQQVYFKAFCKNPMQLLFAVFPYFIAGINLGNKILFIRTILVVFAEMLKLSQVALYSWLNHGLSLSP